MKVRYGEHISILGSTGAGKTWFAKNAVLPVYPRVIVVDTEEHDFNDFPAVSVKEAVRRASKSGPFAVRVVYRGDGTDDLTDLCRGLLKRGGTVVVYFDEVTDFCDSHHIPPPLRALIRKGRKRDISVVCATQRPSMLSKDIYGNSLHRVVFALTDYDAEAVRAYAPSVKERLGDVPYGSHRSLYFAPDGTVVVYGPAPRHDWSRRVQR